MKGMAMRGIAFLTICLFIVGCGDTGTLSANADHCDGYGDPNLSPYILPWEVGKTYKIKQTNCKPATHYGILRYSYDVEMDIGTQLTAMREGTVFDLVESNTDTGGNSWEETNYVYIEHSDGSIGCYVHLTKNGVLVNKGDWVEQGQVIALSGESGTTAYPHLHFHVYRDKTFSTTVPLTFKNAVSNRYGLKSDTQYTAHPFEADW